MEVPIICIANTTTHTHNYTTESIMENEKSNDVLHVVMFPFFAFGHISPFVQLANKLSSHDVKVSFFTASGNATRVKSMLNSAPTTHIVPLTLPQVEGLPPGAESTAELTPVTAELLKVALDLMQPQIRTLLTHLKPHFVLFDFAQEWLPKMVDELGIKTVFYSVFVALSTAFLTCPARVPEPKKYPRLEDMTKPPPGFPHTSVTSVKTFEARDFLYIFKSFHGGPTVYDRVLSGLKGCSAILVKTCSQMEGPYIEYVKAQFNKPVFLVGPVVPDPPSGKLEERWSSWLNKFEAGTVIYCSFGSETFLKDEQIKELALGLEQTGLPFFLVLNFPANVDFSVELNRALPQGFLERVKDKGIIHSGWVQQQHILAHSSVGCYVCHAGFSSVIEALVNDCQVVMLPQKGDQFLNAKLVSGDMKAGVEVNRRDEDGYFGKEDIKEAAEMVMVEIDKQPGKLIRENQKKWKEFLLNKDIQCKFIEDLVHEMMAMAKVSST
ncbi:anthocyanidin-3-O-glucoside rhamnosyltransferase [Nicotiana tabacum]|uniref:Anthocyanidin-3-O-glucoside rhamnosyltransferase n=2 Tax=Nicotiana TaxID=4085 RepID=A0A1S3Z0R2_TOBAC|nr:PREDICTED: anthocyanidin 3-O-glucosyltransferase [Nicotiana sylvestris]